MTTNTAAAPKFTPGPWRACDIAEKKASNGEIYRQWTVRANIGQVCDVFYVTEQGAADARLIAAAPELYELAQHVADYFADTDAPLGIAARAALAKVQS